MNTVPDSEVKDHICPTVLHIFESILYSGPFHSTRTNNPFKLRGSSIAFLQSLEVFQVSGGLYKFFTGVNIVPK